MRDLDAHSWVEAWFPGYGWVTRDPTPAAAPPRSQPGDDGNNVACRARRAPDLGGEPPSRPPTPTGAGTTAARPPARSRFGVLVVAALLRGDAARASPPTRLPPPAQRPMAEFERALRRARYDAGPGVTLARLEHAFAGWPGAAAYVRALREQRYSGRPAAPTRRQRRVAPRCAGPQRRAPARVVGAAAAGAHAAPRARQDVEIVRRPARLRRRAAATAA